MVQVSPQLFSKYFSGKQLTFEYQTFIFVVPTNHRRIKGKLRISAEQGVGRWYPFRRAADNRTHVLPGVRFFLNMKKIELTKGFVALVDDEDFEYLSQWKWFAHKYGKSYRVVRSGQKRKGESKTTYYMHREILCVKDSKIVVDHINGNALDNRRENLRLCTQSQNSKNQKMPCNNTSGFKGVVWDKANKKFAAQIKVDRKCKKIGRFETALEAAKAYDGAAKKYFGDFAKLNFPEHETTA